MNCPHCASATTRKQRLAIGRSSVAQLASASSTSGLGTPFHFLAYPTDVVFLAVLWRLRYKLSLRDLAEMFLERGWEFTHEAVRE